MPSFNISKFRSEPISDNPVYLAQRLSSDTTGVAGR